MTRFIMTKDYAKRRRISNHAKLRPRSPHAPYVDTPEILPAWLWMFTGLILGLILAGVAYWKFHKPNKAHPVVTLEMQDTKPTATAKTASKDSKTARFDFYTMLPSTIVESSEFAPEPATLKTETLAQVASLPISSPTTANRAVSTPQETFIIQAGSFRSRSQAETLKGQLALSGLEASIQTVKIEGKELRYRVNVGPFPNRDQALVKQKNIEQVHRLHSFVVKSHV